MKISVDKDIDIDISRRAMRIALGVVAIIVLAFVLAISGGCSSIPTSQDRPGYLSGRIAAAAWLDTRDTQPAEVRLAVRVAYNALERVVKEDAPESMLEQVIREQMGEITDSAVSQEMVLISYEEMKAVARERLGSLEHADKVMKIAENFCAGADAVLEAQKKQEVQ